MPHEVIMPALGMAQDTGLIVAWLKKPGDAVKVGDALMEVETDKATMEVEAAADGYLTDVRASEGDNVPVGEVIAVISETPEGAGEQQTPAQAEAPAKPTEDATPDYGTPVEGQQVIMPALGMAQDSGKIVAWSKSPGDEVKATDILLEVETDKATMEVEAGHDGWLAETRGGEGDDIPVGEVIAIITARKPERPRNFSRAEAVGAAPAAQPAKAEEPPTAEPEAKAAPAKKVASEPSPARRARPEGRILASPKARRLAAERGLDLARLVEAGHEPPFHVADLETLAALPAPAAERGAGVAPAPARVDAEVTTDALAAFCDWSAAEGSPVDAGRAIAAFAAAALRQSAGNDGAIHLRLARPGGTAVVVADPDRRPLGAATEAVEAPADLTVRDLTRSRVGAASAGPLEAPILTVGRRGGSYALTLDFDPARLDADAAIGILDAVAAQIDEPLRHLL